MKQFENWRMGITERSMAKYELLLAVSFCLACLLLPGGSVFSRLPRFFYILLIFPALEDAISGYMTDLWWMSLLALGAVYRFWAGSFLSGMVSALICLCILGIPYLAWKGSIGSGDVCLAPAIGMWLDPLGGIFFLWLSSVLCLVLYLVLLVVLGRRPFLHVRFGPCLALAGGISYGASCFISNICIFLPPGISFS